MGITQCPNRSQEYRPQTETEGPKIFCYQHQIQPSDSLRHAVDLAQEKGASSWLSSLPLAEFGFSLHKGAFRDALALRYGWLPSNTPIHCACGTQFSVEHSLSCPKGGFPSFRHNEVHDTVGGWMSEVCSDVCIEPNLQPITNPRLDIAANGFWCSRFEKAYFDVRIFNPHAPSNRQQCLAGTYRKHERIKIRAYEQRVREVEHGSFTPLVMSLSGGCGNAGSVCYKRLASMLAEKWDQPYSSTLAWMRCKLSFALLLSAIQFIATWSSLSQWPCFSSCHPSNRPCVGGITHPHLNLTCINSPTTFCHFYIYFGKLPLHSLYIIIYALDTMKMLCTQKKTSL